MWCLLWPLVTIWIKPSYKVKAVLFFWNELHNITGIDEPSKSQDNLQGTVGHLHILVLQQAAGDADVAMVLWGPGGRRGHGGHPAPRAVLHPPGAMHGDVKGHNQVCVLWKVTYFQIETDDEDIPGDPQHQPDRIPGHISRSELYCSKES